MQKIFRNGLPRKIQLLFTFLVFCCSAPGYARDVTLDWDGNADQYLDHYVVYWGTSSGVYSNSENVSKDATTYKVTGLADTETYYFAVTAWSDQGFETVIRREISALGSSDLEPGYARGWAIISGNLKGFKVMYSSLEIVTPTLGPTNDVPILNLTGVIPLGLPINLQPSPTTFNTPVKIFIPCPGPSDLSRVNVYHYDEVADEWLLADDVDRWMVPGSIEEHSETNPYTLSAEVYHFSGAQAGMTSTSSSSDSGGGGGCFIATATF